MTFPRHDARDNPPKKSEIEVSEMTLHSDLISVVGLFEDVMSSFLTENLFLPERKEIGLEYLLSLSVEGKINLFQKLLEDIRPSEKTDLELSKDSIIQRLRNAQKFRNVSAHGGKFQELSGNMFTWTGSNPPKQPRRMKEMEQIMGNSAFDLIDDIKHYIFCCSNDC
ncbi:hypothetical protein [Leucothrix arctica]|uniref:Uncharacterized protein n=1 Tax=Leucothrix arctica TaxID=1481894 RepID=A0A317CNU5_9GAMM|nr:hypothetical protein [Leucothrix arctica]PWQ99867.1 hypothetical protein DKT75_00010 [Leucothrix arctica]